LQGKVKRIRNHFIEIKAFEAKLNFWPKHLRQNVFGHFPCLQSTHGDGETGSSAK